MTVVLSSALSVVSSTVAPASALPLITEDCSAALTMSSPATVLMMGAAGAVMSTTTECVVEGPLVLPVASVAVAVKS